MQHLFIHGSLRTTEGHPLHNYLRSLCDFLGNASIGGIKVDLGGYSGVLPSNNPNERVEGELYRIHEGASEELFDVLDRYEGCSKDDPEPREFFRHRQDVVLEADQKQTVEAWVYLYAG